MTTLFSWTGIDTHGPASIYIASDSRISWEKNATWDVGRKLFASRNFPEVFGYCGSVSFPIQIIGQLIEHIDEGLLFSESDSVEIKIEKVRGEIEKSLNLMPKPQRGTCQILYATRLGNRMRSSFHAAKIKVAHERVSIEEIELPEKSGLIASSGSGKASLNTWNEEWIGKPNQDPHQSGRTSRNVFSAFCDSLGSREDPYSGGAPQLVGIYREGPSKNFGVIHRGKRYLYGVEVASSNGLNSIEWRNELFERCCGETMEVLKKAQRQPKLREIRNP
ncbi:MAG: hypothetical protein CMH22_15740 [Methylophaga sp.]|uniref:hypothetical protein n=1 Tax=Methylophaga sp. UBA678 TaxID=1946901 RepID=UPI000C4F3DC2|nr:hypothetical protein [Methylophaga sp. UBA678]MAX53428.1 hypothetical protein [Methylophaga sp.]|tara:strand:- start:4169 stop:4999 length:831 start_codon:yes stop_codon:yes gene_type:complete